MKGEKTRDSLQIRLEETAIWFLNWSIFEYEPSSEFSNMRVKNMPRDFEIAKNTQHTE